MPAPSSRFAVAALAAIAFALACGGSDLLLPGDGQPASLTIVQGNNQNTRVGEPLAQPIVVQVNDGAGRPVAQARVSFVATGGSGATFSPAFATTDNDGRASAQWSLGSTAGSYTAEARVDGGSVEPARFTAFVAAGTAARIVAVKGSGQMAPVGTVLPDSLVVRATDAAGNPVEGVGVAWSVTGGGSVSEAATATDRDGRAGVIRTLGPTAGDQTTIAQVPGVDGSPVTFAAAATSGSAGKLRLTVQPSASVETGVPFARQPRVQLLDNLDNPVSQAGRAVTVAIANGPGGATLSGQRTRETDATGLAVFTDLAIAGPAGSYSLSFSGADLATVTSASIAVTSGDPSPTRSTVDAEPESFAVAGGSSTLTVRALDDLGNPVGGVPVVPTVDRSEGSFQPSAATTDDNGRASFTLRVAKSGRFIVGARADGILLNARDTVNAAKISSSTTITSDLAQPTQVLAPLTVAWLVTSAVPSRLTGTVTVRENGEARCGGPLTGSCSFTPSIVGTRTISATYAGDDAHEPSSDSRSHVVQPIPTQVVSLTSDRNPATTKETVTFEARVVGATGTPTGVVSFFMGPCGGTAVSLGQATLNGEGLARLNRKLEAIGTFCVIASYLGSAVHSPSQSPPPGLTQVVVLRR